MLAGLLVRRVLSIKGKRRKWGCEERGCCKMDGKRNRYETVV